MSKPCPDCTPNPDGSSRWSNNVAALFPFRVEGEEIVFTYRCGTCRREWEQRKNFDDAVLGMCVSSQKNPSNSILVGPQREPTVHGATSERAAALRA